MEGLREREEAIERRFRRRAIAPSEIWEEMLAAEVPVSLKAGGLSLASETWVVEGRMPSSAVMLDGDGVC